MDFVSTIPPGRPPPCCLMRHPLGDFACIDSRCYDRFHLLKLCNSASFERCFAKICKDDWGFANDAFISAVLRELRHAGGECLMIQKDNVIQALQALGCPHFDRQHYSLVPFKQRDVYGTQAFDDYGKTLDRLLLENSTLKHEIAALKKGTGAPGRPPNVLEDRTDALKESLKALEEEKGALQQELDALKQEHEALKKETGAPGRALDVLKGRNNALKQSLKALEKEKDALQQELAKVTEKKNKYKKDKNELSQKMGDLERKYSNTKVAAWEGLQRVIKVELPLCEKELNTLRDANETLRDESEVAWKKVVNLKHENNSLRLPENNSLRLPAMFQSFLGMFEVRSGRPTLPSGEDDHTETERLEGMWKQNEALVKWIHCIYRQNSCLKEKVSGLLADLEEMVNELAELWRAYDEVSTGTLRNGVGTQKPGNMKNASGNPATSSESQRPDIKKLMVELKRRMGNLWPNLYEGSNIGNAGTIEQLLEAIIAFIGQLARGAGSSHVAPGTTPTFVDQNGKLFFIANIDVSFLYKLQALVGCNTGASFSCCAPMLSYFLTHGDPTNKINLPIGGVPFSRPAFSSFIKGENPDLSTPSMSNDNIFAELGFLGKTETVHAFNLKLATFSNEYLDYLGTKFTTVCLISIIHMSDNRLKFTKGSSSLAKFAFSLLMEDNHSLLTPPREMVPRGGGE